MTGLSFKEAQGGFFDRGPVIRAMDRAERRNLSRYGAFVRQRALTLLLRHPVKSVGAKSRIHNRQGTSSPGEPPYSHTGLLARFLFFAYDRGRRSVVIGPVRAGGLSGEALAALEHGGPSAVWDPAQRKRVTVQIRARPFMGPAAAAEQTKAPALWRDSVR